MNLSKWSEKRHHPRANFDWPVTMITEQETTITGTVRDISRGGVLIHVRHKVALDEQLRLAIEIPDYNDVISAEGKVVRCLIVNEEESPPSHALGIRFTNISPQDLRYFSGNLAPEWGEQPIRKKQPDRPNFSRQKRKKQRSSLQTPFGLSSFFWLLLLAIVCYQSFYHDHPANTDRTERQHELHLLSEQVNNKIESVRQSNQLLATNVIRTEERLAKMENRTNSTDQLDEIHSLIASQALELQQLRSELENITTAETEQKTTLKPDTSHVVTVGDTLFSISKRYNMTVEELLSLNKLAKGTFIHPGQKLIIERE